MRKKVFDVRKGYDLYSERYHEDHNYLDSFDWSETRRWIGSLPSDHGPVLDLGCGDGRTFSRLKDRYPGLIGADISLPMLRRIGPGNTLVQADACSLPFRNDTFGLIFAFFVLVHVSDPREFFNETVRVLKKEGLLLLNNIPVETSKVLRTENHKFVIRSSNHSDEKVLEDAGEAGFSLDREQRIEQKGAHISTLFLFRKY